MSERGGSGGPPRCLHLLPDTDDAGAENQCRYLISGLLNEGEVSPELAYFGEGRAHREFEALGLEMTEVPRKRRLAVDLIGRARRLRHAFATSPPDLLHTWLLEGNVVGLLAARAWPKTKLVITQRGSWQEAEYRGLVRAERLLLGGADAAISNSSGGVEMLDSLGMEPQRISLIRNGVPATRVAIKSEPEPIRAAHGWEGRDVIAWVGRAHDRETCEQKGIGTLFEAFELIGEQRTSAVLALVGPTPEEIQRGGRTLPKGAESLGWQSSPADLINAADLVVVSSRWEGDSNVAAEALMLGVPVVSTDCGDHCRVVRAAAGRVVAVDDHVGLAAAIEATLESPPPRSAVAKSAAELLSVERMVAETTAVYRRLLTPDRDA